MSNGNARGTQQTPLPAPPVNPNSGTNSTANTPSNQTNSTTTVTVCCKLANGFLMEMGVRDTESYVSIGLKGINHMRIAGAQWGITEGVDRAFWEKWREEHKGFKYIRGGFIFAQSDLKEATAQAKSMEGLKTGLERLNPKSLPKGLERMTKA